MEEVNCRIDGFDGSCNLGTVSIFVLQPTVSEMWNAAKLVKRGAQPQMVSCRVR